MSLGDKIIEKTPCCGSKVHLTKTGVEKWTRHCTAAGCRNVYDVTIEDGKVVWKKREERS